jgi:hypothetical protein
MRSMWLFDGIFWGLFFVVIGVWIMVRRYVPVNIPLGRVIFALVFVYLGVRILISGPQIRERNTIVFSDTHMDWTSDTHGNDYNIIFSRGTVDLTGLAPAGGSVYKEVNVVFGSVRSPNGTSVSFRDTVYSTPAYRAGADAVRIKATAVFGTLYIDEAPGPATQGMTPESPTPEKK